METSLDLESETLAEPNLGHELLGDIQALATEAATLVQLVAKGEQTEGAIATLRAQFEVAQAHFTDLYGSARQKAIDGAKQTEQAIRRNPYPSILIIAGAALLAGVFLGRATKSR